ncbi:MAG: 50S ribosomal protein L5 [Myxococcales bacterium]|nr:50S ribosomal protein L5 [Myxococcales bacterium]|tara:strand:- start:259 stop:813 length:555 start_codon:yes stop_codon:yes gene_type:complete
MQNPRLKTKFQDDIAPALMETFGYANVHQIPGVEKVVVNIGLGREVAQHKNTKVLESAQEELATICGQRPVLTRAKRSIAGFKLREGMAIGCSVTLRRRKMWEFLDRLINVALPRVRDFRGLSAKAFDGRGNYTLGIKEQIIFPEIDYDKVDKIKGMNITIVTSAETDEEGRKLLRLLGMPLRK